MGTIELTPECELRLECIRMASDNVRATTGQVRDEEVIQYAERLFKWITDCSPPPRVA
jgi:hypothetical protein